MNAMFVHTNFTLLKRTQNLANRVNSKQLVMEVTKSKSTVDIGEKVFTLKKFINVLGQSLV